MLPTWLNWEAFASATMFPSLARRAFLKRPENFSGLFSGAFLGFRKAFLKAPEFLPRFSGLFSGNVTQGRARASIFQPMIGSKIAIDIAALSWVRHVRIKFKTFSMNRPQSFISSVFVQFQQR